jgi:isopenicillin N synthase-like dioxygenase
MTSSWHSSATLPVVDLRNFDRGNAGRKEALIELRTVAHENGFFYLIGHGISEDESAEVLAVARKFFSLPEDNKLAVAMVNSPHFRGYTRAGGELTRGRQDWREQFDLASEREVRWKPGDPAWMRLQGPNQWPAALPELRPTLLGWQKRMTELAIRLLSAFCEALGQDPDRLAPVYEGEPNEHIKIIRYPGRDQTESDQGVGPHKDSGLLTLLLQDRQDGLEVETADGKWIKAPPEPGTFVVNIGELLELATDGFLRANVHRVITPPLGAERLSVAYFLGARHDSVMPHLTLPEELAGKARGLTQDPQNPLFQHAGTNYLKGRLRSHTDVAARHYAGLVADRDLHA